MKTALTIAGSDCSGGAGIQADLKTMTMNGVYAMSAITALTAQNTTGVKALLESPPDFLRQQIDAVFEDIFPDIRFRLCSQGAKIAFARAVPKGHGVKQCPVEVKDRAFQHRIKTEEDMAEAAKRISDANHCAVLLKGGHSVSDANDLLCAQGKMTWFAGKRINNPNTHGTGCTLSSAIAANLAKGFPLADAVQRAKDYVSGALAAMLDLGKGSGPMMHNFDLNSAFAAENESV